MCAVVGVYGTEEAASWVKRALSALQHRGQESVGVAVSDGTRIIVDKEMGYVKNLDNSRIKKLTGHMAIGHTRYSTAGESRREEAQPFCTECWHGQVAVCHNGNFIDQRDLKREVMGPGATFYTTSDTEIALNIYAQSNERQLPQRLAQIASKLRAAYSMLFMTRENLAAMMDPWGFRPLMIGMVGEATVIASESSAFTQLQMMTKRKVHGLRDVMPGEIIVLGNNQSSAFHPERPRILQRCVFEHVYFSRPDSYTFGLPVEQVRRKLGRSLAAVAPADADIVVPVPNSGIHAGIGYAEASGIPIEWALVRSQYVGRTFISPNQADRSNGVEEKLQPIVHMLRGKRVVLVDDSIVRGTTTGKIVRMVKRIGKAKKVHVRISCPPTVSSCYYGVDTPRRGELIAHRLPLEQIREFIGADSLAYNTLDNLREAVWPDSHGYCYSCYTNNHPLLQQFGLEINGAGLPERRRTVIPLLPA